MDKKNLIKILNYSKYVAFIAATVCVILFQFLADPICVQLALALYVVAFGLMFAGSIIHCVEIYNADKYIKQAHAKIEILDQENEVKLGEAQEEVENVNLKAEKVWSVVGAIFFGCFAIFTLVVLVLF